MNKFIQSLSQNETIEIDDTPYPYLSLKNKILKNTTKKALQNIKKLKKTALSKKTYIKQCDDYLLKSHPHYIYYYEIDSQVFLNIEKSLKELKKHKHCTKCMLLRNHNNNSIDCPINIKNNEILTSNILEYFLKQDINIDNETVFEELAENLQITVNKINTLYSKIDLKKLLNRPDNIDYFIKEIDTSECSECGQYLKKITLNSLRTWRGKDICDKCWSSDSKQIERDELWNKIVKYKLVKCRVCENTKLKLGERYHYDHISMFDKIDSICCMVNQGCQIEEIKSEIDKCEVLCKSCHDLVTKREGQYPFKRIKTTLTRKFNSNKITEMEYETKKCEWDKTYREKLTHIYDDLKTHLKLIKHV